MTGWWFGCHEFSIFPLILGMSSSQLTDHFFQRGGPTTNQIISSMTSKPMTSKPHPLSHASSEVFGDQVDAWCLMQLGAELRGDKIMAGTRWMNDWMEKIWLWIYRSLGDFGWFTIAWSVGEGVVDTCWCPLLLWSLNCAHRGHIWRHWDGWIACFCRMSPSIHGLPCFDHGKPKGYPINYEYHGNPWNYLPTSGKNTKWDAHQGIPIESHRYLHRSGWVSIISPLYPHHLFLPELPGPPLRLCAPGSVSAVPPCRRAALCHRAVSEGDAEGSRGVDVVKVAMFEWLNGRKSSARWLEYPRKRTINYL